MVGVMMRDVVHNCDEVNGLMVGVLRSEAAPAGTTKLSHWLTDNAEGLGRRHVSKMWCNIRHSKKQVRELQRIAFVRLLRPQWCSGLLT